MRVIISLGQKVVMLSFKGWKFVLLTVFVLSICVPFVLRTYEKHQRIRIVKQFAHAIQTRDYKAASQFVLTSERQLGVTPEAIEKAFKLLNLPPIHFSGIGSEKATWPMLLIETHWQKIDDNGKLNVYVELTKEGTKWKINFFFTFRRFCSLKLRLRGWDKVKAFKESRLLAIQILKTAGVTGYITEFGTIRSFEREVKGVITP